MPAKHPDCQTTRQNCRWPSCDCRPLAQGDWYTDDDRAQQHSGAVLDTNDDAFDPERLAAIPADQVCTFCHHLLTEHYGSGDIEASGCGRLGCPCLHSGRGPGLTPAEAAEVAPKVRPTVTTLSDLPGGSDAA